VGQLDDDDALILIRERQPARDPAGLQPNFSSPGEEDAARQIIELLDAYTLAVEQAAVYLGMGGAVEPSELLSQLKDHGLAVLDEVGSSTEGVRAIRHRDRTVGAIIDQTLQRLPPRARDALAYASLLPADSIPWDWLERLTESPAAPANSSSPTMPGLSTSEGWASTRRVLEGRRLLTPAEDPPLTRINRLLQEHLRKLLADSDIRRRLADHLDDISQQPYGRDGT
jgi:hypothetical protein